ncbi:transglutaminase domain-containing protein [Microbacterium enclense]|uniref:transglutaminase domain-containing protein n=1 Tax=Microbacterium enclense TaxID=993073 RepID=UPI003F80981E
MPDGTRQFDVTSETARRTYGIGEELLIELLGAGLPRDEHSVPPRFDALDLENIALEMRLSSPHRTAMRWWADSLARSDEDQADRYEFEMRVVCPSPGHSGSCDFNVGSLVQEAAETVEQLSADTFRITARRRRITAELDDRHALLLEEAARLRFHVLRPPVSRDLKWMASSRLADCRLAMFHLVRWARGAGYTVRSQTGLFMVSPFPVAHCWLEVNVDGEWVPIDPLLLEAFSHWGIIDPVVWPPHRSPAAVLFPVSEQDGWELASHGGQPVEARLVLAWGAAEGGAFR